MDLPLRLSDSHQAATIYNAGVSVDNMTWWFWIKAGMGFTLGAGLVWLSSMIVGWLLAMTALAGILGLLHR